MTSIVALNYLLDDSN